MKEKFLSRDILLLLAASFFYMASPMLVTPVITGFSESLGASALVMGLVGGLTNIASLVFQPFCGNLADRVSKYRLSTVGTLCLLIACAGYTFSVNPAMVLAFRIINGLGFACCSVCFSTWIANLLPPGKVGFGMSLYGMMNATAMAIAPAIGIAIYHRLGYRPALAVAALFALLCLVVVRLCKDKGAPLGSSITMKKEFRLVERKVLPLALVIMCFAIPYCATQSFIVRYSESLDLHVTVGMFFTIYAAALLLLRMLLRNLFDRIRFYKYLAAGSLAALLSMFLLWHMTGDLEMTAAAVCMAGGYGIMCTVVQAQAVIMVRPEDRGKANGTYYIGLNSGMALGPLIGGLLYGHMPLGLFYPLLMLCVPLCLVLYWISKRLTR